MKKQTRYIDKKEVEKQLARLEDFVANAKANNEAAFLWQHNLEEIKFFKKLLKPAKYKVFR